MHQAGHMFCGRSEYTQEVMSFWIEPSAQLLISCLCAAGSEGRCKLLVLRYLSLRLHDGGPQASLTGKWCSAPPETHALPSKGWVQLPVEAELSETHAHRKQRVQMLAGWWSTSWIWIGMFLCGGVQDAGESFLHQAEIRSLSWRNGGFITGSGTDTVAEALNRFMETLESVWRVLLFMGQRPSLRCSSKHFGHFQMISCWIGLIFTLYIS